MKRREPPRLKVNIADLKSNALHNLARVCDALEGREEAARVELGTFINVALRIIEKTNHSKVVECVRAEEIMQRMNGVDSPLETNEEKK